MDFVEICNVCTRKVIIKAAKGYLILIRFVAVIVISILASLFLEHTVYINFILFLHHGSRNTKVENRYK